MAKSTRIQIVANAPLKKKIDHYMQAKDMSQSQAGKALIALGYEAWQQKAEHGLSLMDALKLLLKSSYSLQLAFNTMSDKHIETFNNDEGKPYAAAPLIKAAHRLADEKVNELFQDESQDEWLFTDIS